MSSAATLIGVLAAVAAYLLDSVISFLLTLQFAGVGLAIQTLSAYTPSTLPSLAAVLTLSIVNPIFEEVIVCGYVIPALRERFGVATAINVSVAIRVSYHLYQGLIAFPFHCSYGLIQAHLYVRFGRLWPLIVSHAILDFVALSF